VGQPLRVLLLHRARPPQSPGPVQRVGGCRDRRSVPACSPRRRHRNCSMWAASSVQAQTAKLYFAVGDNGNGLNAQDLSQTRHGKILRINKDGSIPPTTTRSRASRACSARSGRTASATRGASSSTARPVRCMAATVGDFTFEELNHIVRGGNLRLAGARGPVLLLRFRRSHPRVLTTMDRARRLPVVLCTGAPCFRPSTRGASFYRRLRTGLHQAGAARRRWQRDRCLRLRLGGRRGRRT
jgi:hypothetical protein